MLNIFDNQLFGMRLKMWGQRETLFFESPVSRGLLFEILNP